MISFPGSKRTFLPYTFFFTAFLFFNTLFNGSTKTNNLLHLAILFFLFHVIVNKTAAHALRTNLALLRGLLIVAAFLFYFTLSNLWSADPGNITATLTHRNKKNKRKNSRLVCFPRMPSSVYKQK